MRNHLSCVRNLHPFHFTSCQSVNRIVPVDQGPKKPFTDPILRALRESCALSDTTVEMMEDANLQRARPRIFFFWVGLGHTPAFSTMLFLHSPVCLALISLWFPLLQDFTKLPFVYKAFYFQSSHLNLHQSKGRTFSTQRWFHEFQFHATRIRTRHTIKCGVVRFKATLQIIFIMTPEEINDHKLVLLFFY